MSDDRFTTSTANIMHNANTSKRLTFNEFTATGRDAADLREHSQYHDGALAATPGRVYAYELTIERNLSPEFADRGPWTCEVGGGVAWGELASVEIELYGFYVSEISDDDVRPYLIDAAPPCQYLGKRGAPNRDQLSEIYSAFGCMYDYLLSSADEMAVAGVDENGKQIAPEHLKWISEFIRRWDAAQWGEASATALRAVTEDSESAGPHSLAAIPVLDHLIDIAEKRVVLFKGGYAEGRAVRKFVGDLIAAAHRADGDERPALPERVPGYTDQQWDLIVCGWNLRSEALQASGLRDLLATAAKPE